MKKTKLKDITKEQIQQVLLTKQQLIIVDLLIHYYLTVIDTVPVVTGLTRTSFTIGINAPIDYDPAEGHYGMPSAPSAKALLAQLRGKELKVFVGTSVDHKGYIEKQYQTQLLAWHDLVAYAKQTYPDVFGG
jgi:hypothetical protein